MVVPRPDPSLNSPSATAAMIDAFRSGQISANEIADRAIMHPAMVAAVKKATDPALVKARGEQEIADSEKAVIETARAKELANVPTSVLPYYQAAVQAGVMAPVDLKTWSDKDTQQVIKASGDLLEYHKESAKAKMLTGSIKPGQKEDPTTRQVFEVPTSSTTGAELNADAAKAVNNWDAQFGTDAKKWIQAGKPPVHDDLFSAPGIVTAPYVPGTLPKDEGPAPMMSGGVPEKSTGRLIKSGDEKAPTAQQAQAAMFSARALGADEVLKNLEKAGFNPGSGSNWMQSFLIGPLAVLKTADRKAYDAAKNEWSQGLLRLESGAAISNKEQSWYENTFFPTGFDPKEVQDQKARMRSDVEAIANQMAKTGRLDVPALLNVEARADVIHSLSKSTKSAGSSLPAVTVGGRKGRLDNSDPGNPRIIWDTAPAGAKAYAPPETLRQNKKAIVEPK